MTTKRITTDTHYKGYRINTGKNADLPCDAHRLERLYERVEFMTRQYSKVMMVRFDIRFPTDRAYPKEEYESYLKAFWERFKYEMNRLYGNANCNRRVQYLWCKEQKPNQKNPHLHVFCLFNGHKVNSPYIVHTTASRIWDHILSPGVYSTNTNSGLIHYCQEHSEYQLRNGLMMDRANLDENLNAILRSQLSPMEIIRAKRDYLNNKGYAFQWGSYLCKHKPNDMKFTGKSFGYSLLPKGAVL